MDTSPGRTATAVNIVPSPPAAVEESAVTGMRRAEARLLRGLWYLAVPAARLRRGAMLPLTLLGEPVLLCRAADGGVFALRDVCPHRGIPLRYGRFDGSTVMCGYHGWRFDSSGTACEIPSLLPDQKVNLQRIRCGSYAVREHQGLIWIYMPPEGAAAEGETLPPVPELPGVPAERRPGIATSMDFPCGADHAAFGLMDPTHAAFVHTSWWWKRQARKLREKRKDFEPAPLGWRMVRHALPPENRAYRIFGENVTTEIRYALPGLRIEHVEGSRHSAVGLTAITPIDATHTVVWQIFYWTLPWLGAIRPLALALVRRFLDQDRQMVIRQQHGLPHAERLMLVNDADMQARWFHRLGQEWQRAQAEGRPFENPLRPQTLRWRS